MSFLRDLALAHQKHEGYFKGSRSYRLNNPGNLRAGKPSDKDGFTIYDTYEAGFLALQADVRAKICGKSRHINYSLNPTFLTYVRVYAPSDDGNDPRGYCVALCRSLSKYNVQPDTPLTVLAQLVTGKIDRVPDPEPALPPLSTQLSWMTNALRWAKGIRKNALLRGIDRIKKLLSQG